MRKTIAVLLGMLPSVMLAPSSIDKEFSRPRDSVPYVQMDLSMAKTPLDSLLQIYLVKGPLINLRESNLDSSVIDSRAAEEKLQKEGYPYLDYVTENSVNYSYIINLSGHFKNMQKTKFTSYDDADFNTNLKRLYQKYSSIPKPVSMIVKDIDELEKHMSLLYALSYQHYILGKNVNYKYIFPRYCCGISSENLFAMSIDVGYINALVVGNDEKDHNYLIYPFVMKSTSENGCIVVDPTADQLYGTLKSGKKHRNMTWVRLGTEWLYKTEWEDRADLFPDEYASLAEQHYLEDGLYYTMKKSFSQYLSEVYDNPVDISPYLHEHVGRLIEIGLSDKTDMKQ